MNGGFYVPDLCSVSVPLIKKEHRGLKLFFQIGREPLRFFHSLALKEGAFAWLKLGGHRVLFLNDATAIGQIFRKDPKQYHKGIYNEGIRPLLGHSVFMSEEDLWWKQRRDAAPAFGAGMFERYLEQINDAVDAMIDRWREKAAAGTLVDVSREMMLFTLDVVFRTMFNQSDCAMQNEISKALFTMLNLAEQRIWRPINIPMSLALQQPKYQRTMKFLERVTTDLANSRRDVEGYPRDLLKMLLDSHGHSPDEQKLLQDNIISFVLAGHETTANAISWAFLELGRNAAAKARLVAEVDMVANDRLGFREAKSLSYAMAVLNESMRLYPPVWTMSRECLADDAVSLDDGRLLDIPANTTVMLCAYTVHRREAYWKDPESFFPERFLEKSHNRPKTAWFPFGGGPRLCLGFQLAEMEAACVFHKVFRAFDVALLPNQVVKPQPIITLRPGAPIWIRLTARGQDIGEVDDLMDDYQGCPYHEAA